MPGKARHKKRKHSFQSKKKKDRLSRSAIVAQQPAAETVEPISPPTVPPSASVPPPMAKPTAIQYPYISTELRTIGILAGIMLTILIVLALVLS